MKVVCIDDKWPVAAFLPPFKGIALPVFMGVYTVCHHEAEYYELKEYPPIPHPKGLIHLQFNVKCFAPLQEEEQEELIEELQTILT